MVEQLLRAIASMRISSDMDGRPMEGCALRLVQVYKNRRRVELYREAHDGLPKMCVAIWHPSNAAVTSKTYYISAYGDGWDAYFAGDVNAPGGYEVIRLRGEREMLRAMVEMRLAV